MRKNVDETQQQCLTLPENAAIIAALRDVEAKEKKLTRRVVWLQMLVTLIVAGIVYSIKGMPQLFIAVLSGGGIAVANGALLAWRMARTAMHSAHEAHHPGDAQRQLRLMYFYAAERFLVVVALLALCLVALKLSPLALLGGFVIGQAVLITGRLFLSSFETEIVTKNV